MWDFESLQVISKVAQMACFLVDDPSGRRENIKGLLIGIWEVIDPTPDWDLDDRVVEAILDWIVDTAVDGVLN